MYPDSLILETENKYKYSRAYFKILNLIQSNPQEDVFVIRGGQGASKTISILELIIQALLSSEKEASVLSSELSKMKRTVIRDYKKICKDWSVIKHEDEFNKSESKHEYRNGSYVDFLGADVSDLGKGFRRDILYINEADRMDLDTADQFMSRAGITIIDYNPDRLFWGDALINDHNFITLTYEDNEFLSESEVRAILRYREKGFYDITLPVDKLFEPGNIKNSYWANKWRVYGLGLVGNLQGAIFNNWDEVESIPAEAQFIAYGLDWGFTNDQTGCVAVYKMNGELYLKELLYETRLTNNDISNKLKEKGIRKELIIADSAEPKSIEDLRRLGFNVQPAKKGQDSVRASIDIVQRYKIHVTKDSQNLIKELRSYVWETNKAGEQTGAPIDFMNHLIDPLRYVALNKLGNSTSGKYYFG